MKWRERLSNTKFESLQTRSFIYIQNLSKSSNVRQEWWENWRKEKKSGGKKRLIYQGTNTKFKNLSFFLFFFWSSPLSFKETLFKPFSLNSSFTLESEKNIRKGDKKPKMKEKKCKK